MGCFARDTVELGPIPLLMRVILLLDTNNIIILYPQATVDNEYHIIWGGTALDNPNACFDWLGWYGDNADQIGGKKPLMNMSISTRQKLTRTVSRRSPNGGYREPSQTDLERELGVHIVTAVGTGNLSRYPILQA
jgi:hypothetical protein